MDGQRFDQLARAFATGASRRSLLKGLVGAAVGGVVAQFWPQRARAQCSWSGTFQAPLNGIVTMTLQQVGDEVSGSYTVTRGDAITSGTIAGVARTDFPGYAVLDGYWQEPAGSGWLWLSMPLDPCSQFTGSYTGTETSEEWIAGWDGVRISESDGEGEGEGSEGGGDGDVEGDGSADIEGQTAVSCEGHGDCQLALSPCHACDLTGQCRAVVCNEFDCPCPTGQICSFFTCVSACTTDADCPADLVCDCHDDEGRCQEVGHCARACLSDSDCPPGDVCPDWSGTCVPACATSDALRGCVSTCATVDGGCVTVDVVVVGAGLSGLVAARKLAGEGRSVIVLEAQDHVGGRMIRQQVGTSEQNAYVDLGGQWIGPEQHRIQDLATKLGVTWWDWNDEVVDQQLDRDDRLEKYWTRLRYQGTWTTYKGTFLPFHGDDPPDSLVPPTEVQDAKDAWERLNELAKLVNPETPWFSEMGGDAQQWDQQTLAEWFDAAWSDAPRIGGPGLTLFARFAITNLARIGGSGAFEPEDVSLLHMLFTQKQSPQNEEPETYLFHGGAGQIPELLAGWLRGSMVRIDLNAPVGSIEQDKTGVTLRLVEHTILAGSAPAACYRARYAIVAIPPILSSEIVYTPPLPPDQLALLQQMPMGALLKVHAVYPTPFWRTWQEKPGEEPKRLNGIAITDLATTPFTVDSSPSSAPTAPPRPQGPGILTTFIAGRVAEEFGKLPREERPAAVRTKVVEDLVACFGEHARYPDELIVADWPDNDWIRGAFTAYLKPRVWTTYGRWWRVPHDRIYWAGTEMATRWNGYFDGAIQAGEDAADAIIDLLAEPEPTEEPACDPAEEPTETPTAACASDEACGQGAWCNAGVCEPGCNSHTHCGECELCHIVAHQCCFFAGNLCGVASTCPND